jgi:HAD superfamily hydrolase (TIGR01549 family)
MLDRDKVEAVLFDLDGTLMDTDDQAVESLQHRLERLHWPDPPRTARRLIMASETPGNWLMTVLDVFGLDSPLMSFTNQLRRWRGLRNVGHFRIVEGVEEMLAALQGRYRLGIVTTRGAAEAEAFVDQYQLHGVFEVVVTRESTWRLKPHPAPVLHAAQLLSVPAERCVMVGDTTVDIKSARRASAWAVAVLCGFGERKELEQSGAHVVLEHTAHLASVL